MAAFTASRVDSRTFFSPLMTRETVIGDTPAKRATSWMVSELLWRRAGLDSNPFLPLSFLALAYPATLLKPSDATRPISLVRPTNRSGSDRIDIEKLTLYHLKM